MNRADFLERVRRSRVGTPLTDPGPGRGELPMPHPDDLVASFTESASAAGAVVHFPRADPTGVILELMAASGVRSFMSWDPGELPVPGVPAAAVDAGCVRIEDRVPAGAVERLAHQLEYFECDAGITGADAALAATGSVVLGSGPGRARMASLIPDIHIAMVRRETIFGSLAAFLAARPSAPGDVANWTVITGPSRTADIEMVITHGVHGPRELHIVVL